MAEKLKGTDTLREAYPKINDIIDDSDRAIKELRDTKQDIDNQMSEAKRDVQDVTDRVDNIIQGGSPDKDAEVVDMRHPDPEYHPKRPIQVAGDMIRDMQDQLITGLAQTEIEINLSQTNNKLVDQF